MRRCSLCRALGHKRTTCLRRNGVFCSCHPTNDAVEPIDDLAELSKTQPDPPTYTPELLEANDGILRQINWDRT